MRRIQKDDFDVLSNIYYRAVDLQLRSYYEKPQIDYYLRFPRDHIKFGKFLFDTDTWVYEVNGEPVGFSGLESDGHLTSLYVDPEYSRKGIGTQLLEQMFRVAQEKPLKRIYTEANPLSKNFFIKNGFDLISEERRYRGDIPFIRFNMELNL